MGDQYHAAEIKELSEAIRNVFSRFEEKGFGARELISAAYEACFGNLVDRPDVAAFCERKMLSPYSMVRRRSHGIGDMVDAFDIEPQWVSVARLIETFGSNAAEGSD